MDSPVFITCDITPEQWKTFVRSAAINGDDPIVPKPFPDDIVPYVLIHSRSQEDVASPTVEISSTTKSEFVGAPWTEIRDAFLALDELEIPTLETSCFLVLDAKSYEDHTVVIWYPSIVYEDKEGDTWEAYLKPGLLKYQKWEKVRVPYDRVISFTSLYSGFHSAFEIVDEYLEEVVKELVCEIRESDLDGRGELKEEYSRMFLTTAELNCGGIRRLLSWPQDGGQDD